MKKGETSELLLILLFVIVALVFIAPKPYIPSVAFKEISLEPNNVGPKQEAQLWLDIQNNGQFEERVAIKFTHSDAIRLVDPDTGKPLNGDKVFLINGGGYSTGRRPFSIDVDYNYVKTSATFDIRAAIWIYGNNTDTEVRSLKITSG